MTVRENVQMALLSHAGRSAACGALATHALGASAPRRCSTSSACGAGRAALGVLAYGDLKRVELAMALANEPRLLLMDEPTAGMAPERARRADGADRRDRARAQNLGVLFTEHDMDVVFRHADRIIVLSRGRLIAEGKPDEVQAQSRGAGRLSRRGPDLSTASRSA